jgi:phosphinothricin acetyltransferase
MIRLAAIDDAETMAGIYNHHVLNTIVTFEEHPVSIQDMAQRLAEVASAALPWLVVEQDGQVVGYAYASKWKSRSAYRFTVEDSVYLAPECTGRGLGTDLLAAVLAHLKNLGIHAVVAGIALPNPASVALHEKLGLKKVGHFDQVGFKFGRWIDVGYWQAVL